MTTRGGGSVAFEAPEQTLGALPVEVTARIVAAASDVAMVIDSDGVIRDLAVGSGAMVSSGFGELRQKRWIDTVAEDSRIKVSELLRDAGDPTRRRWREINHKGPDGASLPVRFMALDGGRDGQVIAVGRDLSAAAEAQERMLQAQFEMERDFARLRQSEARYRALFKASAEPVLVVDAATRRVVEANAAAMALLGLDANALNGQLFSRLFAAESQDAASAALGAAIARTEPVAVQLARGGEARLSVTGFRQERAVLAIARLEVAGALPRATPDDPHAALDKVPDAFVLVDRSLNILSVNTAFLALAQLPDRLSAHGQPLAGFVGRTGVELTVLQANLREHGWVRNFATVLRNAFDGQEDVDLSAVAVADGDGHVFGISLRAVARRPAGARRDLDHLPRSSEQLTGLIGRAPLKEIVRETTDIIERLCIEAALELTGNNRASAAEMLGLSRQSLYSKLHRYGLATPGSDGDDEA